MWSTGINRNIVECKGGKSTWKKEGRTTRINRNIVECKAIGERSTPVMGIVLIETLWNVKLNSSGEMLQVFLY